MGPGRPGRHTPATQPPPCRRGPAPRRCCVACGAAAHWPITLGRLLMLPTKLLVKGELRWLCSASMGPWRVTRAWWGQAGASGRERREAAVRLCLLGCFFSCRRTAAIHLVAATPLLHQRCPLPTHLSFAAAPSDGRHMHGSISSPNLPPSSPSPAPRSPQRRSWPGGRSSPPWWPWRGSSCLQAVGHNTMQA